MGLIIMEPDVRRRRISGGRGRRCPGMKRVPRWSRFAFRCRNAD